MSNILGNTKNIVLALLILGAYHYYRNAEEAKRDRDRLEENYNQEQSSKETGISQAVLTKPQIIERIKYDPEMKELLKESNIKVKNLTQIVTAQSEYIYKDSVKRYANDVLNGIYKGIPVKENLISNTKCHSASVDLTFDGEELYLDSLNIKTTSKTDYIYSREKWRLKHLFKKRKIISTSKSDCGESTVKIIKITK